MRNTLRLAFLLAKQDVKQTYRRSLLGQAWITIGMAVLILAIGLVFGLILDAEIESYLPFLASGIIVFYLISGIVNEGSQSFIAAESMIKQSNAPLLAHHLRVVFRNVLNFGHNIAIFPFVLLLTGNTPNLFVLLFPVGLFLTILATSMISLSIAFMAARYRDIPPIVQAVMTVAFYVSPVIWSPENIDDGSIAHFLLGLNPVYHLLQITRLPLIAQSPTLTNWLLALLSVFSFSILSFFTYKNYKNKIVYWV